MGSNQSKPDLFNGFVPYLGNHQGTLNKLRAIDYSCHELLHTWSPSCSEVLIYFSNFHPRFIRSIK